MITYFVLWCYLLIQGIAQIHRSSAFSKRRGVTALATMLVVRANAAREAARVAVEEEAARVAARAVEAALDLAAREEAAATEEVAREAACAVARAEEQAAAEAVAQEDMARDRRRWDEDMAAARCLREVHVLATHCRHRRNLARRQAQRARQAGEEAPTP
jgi:hypothetical protein